MQDYFQSILDSADHIVNQLFDHFAYQKGSLYTQIPEVLQPIMLKKLVLLVNNNPKFQQWKDGSKFIYKFEVFIDNVGIFCKLVSTTPRDTLHLNELHTPILQALGPLIDGIPKNTISWPSQNGFSSISGIMFSTDMWKISTIPFETWVKQKVQPFLYPGFIVESVTIQGGLFYIRFIETEEQSILRHQKIQEAIKQFV